MDEISTTLLNVLLKLLLREVGCGTPVMFSVENVRGRNSNEAPNHSSITNYPNGTIAKPIITCVIIISHAAHFQSRSSLPFGFSAYSVDSSNWRPV